MLDFRKCFYDGKSVGREAKRIHTDQILMTATPFKSDNAYAGIPYRVLKDASVEALMPNGELANFKTVEQFLAAANEKPESSYSAPPITTLDSAGQWTKNLPASTQPLDYFSILQDTIKRTQNNSAQLRQLIYERARFNFKRDILFGHSTLGLADLVRHVNDFELAVARIEANSVGEPADQLDHTDRAEYEPTITPSLPEVYTPTTPVPPIYASFDTIRDGYVLRPRRSRIYDLMGMSAIGLVVFGVIFTAGMMWSSRKSPLQLAAVNEPAKITAPAKPEATGSTAPASAVQEERKQINIEQKALPYPLPTSFGIYALNNNELTELQTLPIGVPDPRVALSAEITKPSGTTISDNKPAFILFRRELLNSAPQTLALRVVARVVRETKIVSGKATVTNIDGAWRVRNVSHELKVSPVPGQPEMIMARAPDDAPLPAGRYALVLNRVGYDFTIKGKEESPEFCLEGFEASNGSIFSQCRTP